MNFSFLYGTFPPALGVMSYASQYSVCPELVSAGIVLCTAVSAPLMFLSTEILKILSISSEEEKLSSMTRNLDYHMAILSMVGVTIILTIFIVSKRYTHLPHCFTTALLLQSLIAPLSAVLLHHGLVSLALGVGASKSVKCQAFSFLEINSRLRRVDRSYWLHHACCLLGADRQEPDNKEEPKTLLPPLPHILFCSHNISDEDEG